MTNNISHPSEFINVVLIPKWENDAVNEVHLLVLFSDGRKIFILFIFRALEPQKPSGECFLWFSNNDNIWFRYHAVG